MKKTLIIAAIFAAALAVSCQPKEIVPQDLQIHDYRTVTLELPAAESATRIAINESDGKVSWVAGDKIKIHGEKVAEMQTIELKASDISADGRYATITFDAASMTPYGVHDYYALYPAEAAGQFLSTSSAYHYCEFTDTNKPLMAAYLDKDNSIFVFRNLCAVISFKVTGNYDSYAFVGNNEETVGYAQFAIKRTADDTYTKARNTPMTTLNAPVVTDGSTPNLICIPEGADFTQGFSIRLKKSGEIVKEAKTSNPVTLGRRKLLALGDITDKLVDYVPEAHHTSITGAKDLGASETANCYVITAPGSYKIPVVKGNSRVSAGVRAKAKLIWETYNNNAEVEKNSVIAAVDYDDDDNYVYFKTPSTLKPGNALIAALDKDENILWSWHIWIPATTIQDQGDYNVSTKYFMDRNLGALVVAEAKSAEVSPQAFGLLYQWGRKDPFVSAGALKSETKATVAGEANGVTEDTSFDLAASYANPTTFAKNNAWRTGDEEWNPDGKSIDDPCPAGYCVPDYDASLLWSSGAITSELFDASSTYGWWKIGQHVFPLCGYSESGGGISHAYDRSRIMSGQVLDASGYPEHCKAQYVYESSGAWKRSGDSRKRYAGSIRCVKIGAEVPEPEAQGATSVVIDGNMSDWASATAIPGGTERIVEWKFGSDASNLYFYYKITQSKIKYDEESGDYAWGSYIYVALDTDNNDSTGDLPELGGLTITGLEALALVYPWRGNFNDSSLATVNGEDENGWIKCPLDAEETNGVIAYGSFDGTYAYVELSIPRELVGSPAAGKIKVQHSMNWYLTPIKAITIK